MQKEFNSGTGERPAKTWPCAAEAAGEAAPGPEPRSREGVVIVVTES